MCKWIVNKVRSIRAPRRAKMVEAPGCTLIYGHAADQHTFDVRYPLCPLQLMFTCVVHVCVGRRVDRRSASTVFGQLLRLLDLLYAAVRDIQCIPLPCSIHPTQARRGLARTRVMSSLSLSLCCVCKKEFSLNGKTGIKKSVETKRTCPPAVFFLAHSGAGPSSSAFGAAGCQQRSPRALMEGSHHTFWPDGTYRRHLSRDPLPGSVRADLPLGPARFASDCRGGHKGTHTGPPCSAASALLRGGSTFDATRICLARDRR